MNLHRPAPHSNRIKVKRLGDRREQSRCRIVLESKKRSESKLRIHYRPAIWRDNVIQNFSIRP